MSTSVERIPGVTNQSKTSGEDERLSQIQCGVRARLKYICSNLSDECFSELVEKISLVQRKSELLGMATRGQLPFRSRSSRKLPRLR